MVCLLIRPACLNCGRREFRLLSGLGCSSALRVHLPDLHTAVTSGSVYRRACIADRSAYVMGGSFNGCSLLIIVSAPANIKGFTACHTAAGRFDVPDGFMVCLLIRLACLNCGRREFRLLSGLGCSSACCVHISVSCNCCRRSAVACRVTFRLCVRITAFAVTVPPACRTACAVAFQFLLHSEHAVVFTVLCHQFFMRPVLAYSTSGHHVYPVCINYIGEPV